MKKSRLIIVAILALSTVAVLIPIETTIVPKWQLEVVDVNGTRCPNMRVTENWGHYRLFLDGNFSSEDRFTDKSGLVLFPKRVVRASIVRRFVMAIITRLATIMHGGWRVDGAVWASGIKDVAWLSSRGDSMPNKMRVEECINGGTERALGADSPLSSLYSK